MQAGQPHPEATAEDLLRVLADPERLAVAGALALGPADAGALSVRVGKPLQRVRRHLAKLTAAGLATVEQDRRTYRLRPETLRDLARAMAPSRDPGMPLGAVDDEEEAVLRHYFRGGRLREIPAKRSKRLIVLTRLALEFDVGVRYPEAAVNECLRRFHPDHAALRRYLVDEGFLSREAGAYWRSGGPVDV
jgi:hypothetical protein